MKYITSILFLLITNLCFGSHQRAFHLFYDHIPNSSKYVVGAFVHFEPLLPVDSTMVTSNSTIGDFWLYSQGVIPVANGSNCAIAGGIHIYRSDTLDLGQIPQAGFTFGLKQCCRQAGITNLQFSAGTSQYVELWMYPDPGQTYASSSPRMVNPVMQKFVETSSIQLYLPALDPDNDSLHYKFVNVMSDSGQSLNYNTGYSATQVFGIGTNTAIDQNTGKITATNVQPAYLIANLQVESYKNGILTSSVQMDFLISALPIPIPIPSISINNEYSSGSPIISNSGSYYVSMNIGDSINFDVDATVLINDSVSLRAKGQLLSNSSGSLGSCQVNCANYTSPTNFKNITAVHSSFSFKSDSSHVLNSNGTTFPIVFTANARDSCSSIQQSNVFIYIEVLKSSITIKENLLENVSVYPNPTNEYLYIERPYSEFETVELTDLLGRKLRRVALTEVLSVIDVTEIKSGCYYLISDKGWVKKVKVN